MSAHRVAIWKGAPFIRFVLPLMVGIVVQWYLQLPVTIAWCAFAASLLLVVIPFFLFEFMRFRFAAVGGVFAIILFISLGGLLVWYNDIRHDSAWFDRTYNTGEPVMAVLQEPLVEKMNSYKALATITRVCCGQRLRLTTGKAIIYFEKDTTLLKLTVATEIIFAKPLQEISGAMNPGGFNFKRYNVFQGITHQTYLKATDLLVLHQSKPRLVKQALFRIRDKVLSLIRRYIPGQEQQGLAEALLIGYKDDLDKNLVQSYTNTGVVHVIAISGLHLGLIYWLLVHLFMPLKRKKRFKWVAALMTIAGLWLFSFVAGAQPSVLRSAVMFTCIALAESFSRRTSIYNSLAFSAFVLLCVNPYWLWDVGFQLSYSAVLSIVIFMKPIYNWFYIKNKMLDFVWKLNAVSLAAQLLTTPLSIYHFHQFPNYFLLANFVAVPLSSVIVLGELALCLSAVFPFIACFLGKVLALLITLLNSYIEKIESIPYSLWEGMQINVIQAVLLFLVVGAFGIWLMEARKVGAWVGLLALSSFVLLRSVSFYQSGRQRTLIIYNIPKHQAIEVFDGRHCFFIGDSDVVASDVIKNFHLKPSHIRYRVSSDSRLSNFIHQDNLLQFGRKRILLADRALLLDSCMSPIAIDLLVFSKNPKLNLYRLVKTFKIGQVVFDASASRGKLKTWKNDCDSLRIPYYDVSEKGAFVMKLN